MQSFPFDSELTYDEHDNPIYDRAVSSQPLRKLIRELFTTGIMPNPSTNLQVSAGNDGMTVQIAAGFAVIDGGLCHETETRTLEVTAADNTYDRIDTVVLRWNENVDVRTADLYVIAGIPAVNPVRPTLQRNNSIYEIGLADVFITKRVATITNDKITDTRYEAERCGIVSSISEFDTTTLYQQVQSDLVRFKRNEENTFDSWANDQQTSVDNWIAEQQASFISWVQSIKDMLDEDAAGHLQNEIDAIRPRVTTNLLNPSLFTIANIATVHGLTITNNGDGTFTVNGTTDNNVGSDGRIAVNITTWAANTEIATGHSQIKLCGTPSSVNKTGMLQLADYNSVNDTQWRSDLGDGVVINTVDSKVKICALRFEFLPNTTFDNAVFKPMLTADLQATYDDYVQYSGDGELNENVAKHEKDIAQLNANLSANDGQKFQFSKSGTKYGYTINGVFHPFEKVQASKAVTASTSALTVTPDSGYDGLASVTVNPTPSQSKSITATTSAQTVNPDSGNLLSKVTVNPQVHSGTRASVTSNGTIDLGANHATRYVPVNISPRLVGTYSSDTTINISSLGATSASQFLVVCDTEASGWQASWNLLRDYNRVLSSHYYPPSITSFSASSLTLSVGKITNYVQTDDDGHATGTVYVNLSTKVYFIG